jgi:hypothetical protein
MDSPGQVKRQRHITGPRPDFGQLAVALEEHPPTMRSRLDRQSLLGGRSCEMSVPPSQSS